jgi:hypothetical protein
MSFSKRRCRFGLTRPAARETRHGATIVRSRKRFGGKFAIVRQKSLRARLARIPARPWTAQKRHLENPCYARDMEIFNKPVSDLTGTELLDRFEKLAACDRRNTVQLLIAIAEIDARRLWATRACSSMFEFCVRFYHMSEALTAKRIWAARTARRFPVLLGMLERGDIHLGAVHLLARHLTDENHRALLARARHRSSREIETLVAEIAPQPDVPSRIRARPQRRQVQTSSLPIPGVEADPGERFAPTPARAEPAERSYATHRCAAVDNVAAAPASQPTRRQVRALAPRRYKVEITVDEETHDKLRRLQDLLGNQATGADPAEIVSRAIDVLLEQTLKRKAALTDRPRAGGRRNGSRRPGAPQSDPGSNVVRTPMPRRIPAAVRREVWLRDDGACVFVDGSGERCGATRHVEFHHRTPFARGGAHEASNIELRCRAHNQAQADLDFGTAFMNARRRR